MTTTNENYKPKVGDRIYYTGDMANSDAEGTIIAHYPKNKYVSECFDIEYDDGRISKRVLALGFRPQAGQRFWSLEIWEAKQKQAIDAFIAKYRHNPAYNKHTLHTKAVV